MGNANTNSTFFFERYKTAFLEFLKTSKELFDCEEDIRIVRDYTERFHHDDESVEASPEEQELARKVGRILLNRYGGNNLRHYSRSGIYSCLEQLQARRLVLYATQSCNWDQAVKAAESLWLNKGEYGIFGMKEESFRKLFCHWRDGKDTIADRIHYYEIKFDNMDSSITPTKVEQLFASYYDGMANIILFEDESGH